MKSNDMHYIGGRLGGNRRSTTYYPGSRPGDPIIQKERQALVRRFGQVTIGSSAGFSGHTAVSPTSSPITPETGAWVLTSLTVADNDSETLDFGAITGVAHIFIICEIKRNHSTPVRESRIIRITQADGHTWMGQEIERNDSGDNTDVTITLISIGGTNIGLTFATSNATPDATADIQLFYVILEET